MRVTMGEVGCTVEWVDDPTVGVFVALQKRFFLGQDRVLGKMAGQNSNDSAFALTVGLGHQVDGAFVVDGLGFMPVGMNDLARGVGCLPSGIEICAEGLRHDLPNFRKCFASMLANDV